MYKNYNQQLIINDDKYEEIDAGCYAIDYLERQISIIPLIGRDKKPAIPWKEYQTQRASKTDVEHWFYGVDYNVGIVTGELSSIVVLDIDSEEAYEFAQAKGLPDTPTVKTGCGHHLYFKYKDGVRNFQKRDDLPGIDLRGEGGYVVAPPSIHPSGVRYQWIKGMSLDDLELAELPDWVLAKAPEEKKPLVELADGVSKGNRNESLTRLLGPMVKTMTYEEVVSKTIEWNSKCDPPDDEQQVMRTVNSIWEREHAGPPEDIGVAWEEPVLFDTEALPAITADLVPGHLGTFAGAVSRSIQAPEGMAVMLGLSVIATALQKKIVVSPDANSDYVEPVNVWTVVVADPSERKSPVLREMNAPVHEWQAEQHNLIRERQRQVQTERNVIDARIKKLTADAGKTDSLEERTAFLAQIEELNNRMPEEVKAPILITGSVTTERLEQLLAENDEKITLSNDEGGIFEIMAGLYSNGKVNIDIFLQGYSGNPVRTDRASRCAHMNNPLLTIGLAIQPKVLQDLSKGSKRAFRGNGLLARFLYYISESRRGERFYDNHQPINSVIRERYCSMVKSLLDIPLEYDEFRRVIPRKLYLDKEAKGAWVEFHDDVERKQARGEQYENIAEWAGKLHGYALRIAGLFHAVEHGVTVRTIHRETMEKAIQLMKLLIPHAKNALSATTTSDLAKDAEAVVEWVVTHEHREFAKRDLQRGMQSRFPSAKELDTVLSELVSRHIIRVKPTHKGMGRPSTQYEVNPFIF